MGKALPRTKPPTADNGVLPYRPCAGMMVVNDQGKIFVGHRINTDQHAWQMPQGGINAGEEPRQAALRELEEEIGTNKGDILAESAQWLTYDLPDSLLGKVWNGRYRGQRQRWFLLRFTGVDSDINIATEHPEFDAWQWVAFAEVLECIVPFKRDTYKAVCAEFAPLVAALAPRSNAC